MRILLLFALLAANCAAQAGTLTGRVARVTQGDALVLVDANYAQHRISLLGIAAPVYGQPYGAKSRGRLAEAVAGRFVVVEYAGRDRHERILGKVLLGNRDMNLEQIGAGLAWHNLKHQYRQSRIDREKYTDAEQAARHNKLGFWAAPVPATTRGQPLAEPEELEDSAPLMDESRMQRGR